MKFIVSAALLLVAVAAATAENTNFKGYNVLRVEYTAEKASFVRETVASLDLDVWADSSRSMDVMVSPGFSRYFLHKLYSKGIHAHVLIEDVQELIDEQFEIRQNRPKTQTSGLDHTKYRTFEELFAELDGLEATFPDLITSSVASTTTYEGRDMRIVTVSSDGSGTRPTIWIDCGIHAREWVSQATCMYIIDQLTSQYGVDSAVTSVLDTYDFQLLPITNPDGYVYSWESNRVWRKNRTPYGVCHGCDCNRNFDSHFGGPGASDAPCADTYHGPSAFSEVESSTIRDATLALGTRLSSFFTLHSYSQYWMTPYGYNFDLPADYDEMMRVTEIGVDALTAVYGTSFVYGNIADVIYVASGGSTDWVYDSQGCKYPFALELRDQGQYGFLLPEDQILPTGIETFAGIMAAVQALP